MRPGLCVTLELVGKAFVEPDPLSHHFPLVVTLLPPLQPVPFGVGLLILGRAQTLPKTPRPQLALERVQHVGNVVVELRPRQRR